jgi:hypothetical protein
VYDWIYFQQHMFGRDHSKEYRKGSCQDWLLLYPIELGFVLLIAKVVLDVQIAQVSKHFAQESTVTALERAAGGV